MLKYYKYIVRVTASFWGGGGGTRIYIVIYSGFSKLNVLLNKLIILYLILINKFLLKTNHI